MNNSVWKRTEIRFLGFDPAVTEGDVVTIRIQTPAGDLRIMAEVDVADRMLLLHGFMSTA